MIANEDAVFAQVRNAVDTKVNEVVNPQGKGDHVVGELNFLRRAEVDTVKQEKELLAGYGDPIFDCDCENNKRIDYQECKPVEGRDVSLTQIIKKL